MTSFIEMTKPIKTAGYGDRAKFGKWVGKYYYDEALKKPFWWTGSVWVDASGNDGLWPDTWQTAWDIDHTVWCYGALSGGEVDFFGIPYYMETKYTFYIEVLTGDGFFMVVYDDTGTSVISQSGLVTGGTYSIAVQAGDTTQPMYVKVLADGPGTYRFRYLVQDTIEPSTVAELDEASNSPINTTINGRLHFPGDVDWYRWVVTESDWRLDVRSTSENFQPYFSWWYTDWVTGGEQGWSGTTTQTIWSATGFSGVFYLKVVANTALRAHVDEYGEYKVTFVDDSAPQ